jgi:uncharacterized membrane protein YidH (DUF202 family)
MANPQSEKRASVFTVAKAVLWSVLGIRRRTDMQSDVVRITPLQVAVMGLIGAALFVAALVLFVNFVVLR